MNYEIFISHSSKDKQIADAICHMMEENGIRCWIAPRDVRPGQPYAREILHGIRESKIMVLVFSKNSNLSRHVLNEIDKAFGQGKTIIPFIVDQTEMNEEFDYYLCSTHWLTAYPNYRNQLQSLVETAAKYLGTKPTNSESEAKEEPQPAPSASEVNAFNAFLKVETDLDCRILVDGEDRGTAVSGNVTRVALRGGSYHLRFVAADFPDIFVEEKRFHIDRDAEEWYGVELMALKKAAEEKKIESWWDNGEKYYKEGNHSQAVHWYKKAAEQGHAKAQSMLGWCYQYGEGTATDKAQAVKWYKKAAEQGDAYAQCNLGWCYQQGIGTTTDNAQAFSWYKKAAEQGNAYAQCNLGVCCEYGRGTTTDKAKAVYWYQKAAEQGNERALKAFTHLIYSEVGNFGDGLAAAKKNGKWGYIDKNGKEISPFF